MPGELAQLCCVHEYEKTYWVMVEGDPTQDKLDRLARGIQLKDYRTLPATVRIIPAPGPPLRRPKPVTPHGSTAYLEIKLREGKKRQIRHMTAAVGLFTLRLVRLVIGRVQLEGLKVGEWRELGASEVEWLKKQAKYNHSPMRYVRRVLATFHLIILLVLPAPARADSAHRPAYEMTVYDLVNTVNALRAAYGLPLYSINSILMFTAQNQAEFMASTGQVTHSGPGGITLTQRLLAAGYPLAGDLSAGGFRAENITSGREGISAESAVDGWMGDALHQNTMLSVNLTEIGAGVAVANGRVYLAIDAACPIDAPNVPSASTSVVGDGSDVPAGEALISPVVLSTPNAKGEVIHEVRYGQTLWRLAISYGVKIDDIKRLNGLFDNIIYPGNRLLIKLEATHTPVSPTATVGPTMTLVPRAMQAATAFPAPTTTPTPRIPGEPDVANGLNWAIGIIAFAILGGGVFAWFGSNKSASKSR